MNRYLQYTQEQLEEHFSNFLIDSWSYSKVSSFARNEKAFEKEFIYNERGRKSATTIAGSAYHKALEHYFGAMKDGLQLPDSVQMESIAQDYIMQVDANEWKIQKTTPTVEDCIKAAFKSVSAYIRNFFRYNYIYGPIKVLENELKICEWVTVNGVDIPLPLHAQIDRVCETPDGKVVIIDDKTRRSFTDVSEIALTRGKQAVTYVIALEAFTGITADEVWFVENKASESKDGSPNMQKYVMKMDEDSRRLYEAMLYEPLRRMVEAVNDPDYVYMINDSDNLADKAELYQFWTRTMIADVDDFEVPDSRKDKLKKRLKKIRDTGLASISPEVIRIFEQAAASFLTYDYSNKNMSNKEIIEHLMRSFGIPVEVAHIIDGYSSDTYLLNVQAGIKMNNIFKYRMDIANALNVPQIRINPILALYEGRSYLSIEVSKKRTRDLLWDASYLQDRKIPVGVDNYGNTVVWDMDNHATPHMLICGATGSGKSVCISSTIAYALLAGVQRVIVCDPKFEFCSLAGEKVTVVSEIEDIERTMKELVEEMQQRRGRNLGYTLIVFDEFADAVQSARSGNELNITQEVITGYYASGEPKKKIQVIGRDRSLEENLKMILQKGRSLGYRVIAATQRASTKIITGDAKVNFPVQVCFRVPKAIDSKVVLDEEGAESLAGYGDGLMRSPEYIGITRFQGFYKGD